MNPASFSRAGLVVSGRFIVVFATLIFLIALNLQADAPPTNMRIQNTGSDSEGLQTFRLEWDAVSNATYRVQRSGSLVPSISWETMDLITPVDSIGHLEIKGRSIPENSVEFFRLLLPQPVISAVEPAILSPGQEVDLYVLGQCFQNDDVVRINGVDQTGVVFVSPNLLSRPVFTPGSPGTYTVQLVRGGVLLSSLDVTCADVASAPELVLQGPPELPPAAPGRSKQSEIKINLKSAYTTERSLPGGLDDEDSPSALTSAQCDFFATGDKVRICHRTSSTKNPYTIIRTSSAGCRGVGSAIEPFSGEVCLQAVDLAIEGRGLDFVWARTYHSRIGRSGAAANGWTFSYDVHLQPLGGDFVIHDGAGRSDTFKLNTNGIYTCPEFFSEGTLTGGVFRLTFADTGYWEFNPIDATSPDAKLARIVDRNGNTISLNYDGVGQLVQIVDDLDRTNTVAYDTAGRLASVTDFSGRSVTYQYYGVGDTGGSSGDLKSVTSPPVTGTPNKNDFPNGKTTTYTYSTGFTDSRENHLLTSITDPKGQTTHTFVYQHNQTDLEFLRCIREQCGGPNETLVYKYLPQTPSPANGFAAMKCIVNDRVGNVSELLFDSRQRCLMMREFTGRAVPGVAATETSNRPVGKLRADDPDFFETRWKWNDDSLCTLETLPNGARTEMIYERAYSISVPPAKKGNLRVLRQLACCGGADTDDDGVPDTTERVWRFDYDPRFGSPANRNGRSVQDFEKNTENVSGGFGLIGGGGSATQSLGRFAAGPRQSTSVDGSFSHRAINTKGTGATVRNSVAGNYWGHTCAESFVTSVTDPRGNVTTASYDATGNCVRAARDNHLQGGVDVITELRFSYNTHGQLTAITNAADANVRYFWSQIVYGDDPFTASYGKPVEVIEDAASDGLALTTSFEYDLWGNVTRIVDPLGNDCKFHNNALNQRVRIESPTNITARCATDYFYDANDNLVQTKVELRDETDTKLGDISAFYEYDILDCPIRVTEQIDATHNAVTEFAYDANRQLALVRSPEAVNGNDPHNITQFLYDERGLLFRESSAPGSADQSTAQYDYNADGNLTRVSEGLEETPRVTVIEYDGFAGFGSSSYQAKQVFGIFAQGNSRHAKSKEVCGNGFQIAGGVISGNPPPRNLTVSELPGLRAQGPTPLAGAARLIAPIAMEKELRFSTAQAWVETVWNKQCVEKDTSVSKITDPMGNVTTFNYDANGNIKLIRQSGQTNDVPGTNGNIRLAESRYEYDGLDQLVRSRDAFFNVLTQSPIGDGESTTTFAYAPNGACTSITDDLSRTTRFTYDTACRLASVIDPKTNVVSYTYDAADNIVGVTSTEHSDLSPAPQEFIVIHGYDKLHRLTRSVDNVGNTNRYAYDSRGNLLIATDPRGNDTCYQYDGLSRCTGSISYVGPCDAAGITISTSHVEYDSNSRCVASTDSNGNVTQYSYDSRNRIVLFGGMDGTSRNLVWSPRSNLLREQDANGTVVSNSYDLLDRCVRRDITPAPGVATTTTFERFEYDGLSHLMHASNNVSCSSFVYDSLGNKIKATQDCLAAAERTFDSVGNCLSLAYRGGTVLTYTYNALDEVTSVSRSAGGLPPATLATFSYEGPGRVGRVTRNNGVNTRITWNGMANPANDSGDFGWQQVSSVNHQVAGGGAVIDRRGYSYDRNQNKTLRDQLSPFTGDSGMTANIFDYDALDRLRLAIKTKGTSAQRNDYTLDGNGNRVNVLVMDNGATQLQEYTMTNTLPEPADFQMNQYTLTPFGSQQYDHNGNLVARNANQVQYFYDYADRLVHVDQLGGSGGMEPLMSFTYDALGRRISKTTYPPAPLTPVTTQFIHGEICDDNIEVYENGVLKEVFVHVSGLSDQIRENDSVLVSFPGTGQPHYYHCDELGNVLALTGAAPGDVLERYDYEDYGIPRFLNADGSPSVGSDGLPATSSAWGNTYLFHGMSWEPETQLYFEKGWPCRYEGPRFYDARIGRNTTRAMTVNEARPMEPRTVGGGGHNLWTAMKTGKVKFFNDAKEFGRVMKEEGGRHTPFHNKYRPSAGESRQSEVEFLLRFGL